MLYRNPDSMYDRRFSSDTRTFYRNTSFLKRKSNANEDVLMSNGTTPVTSSTSRTGRGNYSNGSSGRDERQVVCVESGL